MSQTAERNLIGYYVVYQASDDGVRHLSYDELNDTADMASFDRRFIPTPPEKQKAFRSASNLKAGVHIRLSDAQKAYGLQEHGGEVSAKLVSYNVGNVKGNVIRHIYRILSVKTDKTEKQIDSERVAVLSYDVAQETLHVSYTSSDYYAGTVTQQVCDEIRQNYQDRLQYTEGADEIRQAYRNMLFACNRIKKSSAGTYFVPASRKQQMDSMYDWTQQLNDLPAVHTPIECTILPLYKDRDGYNVLVQLRRDATTTFEERLQEVYDKYTKFEDGKGNKTTLEGADKDLFTVKADIAEYRKALRDDLSGLDSMLNTLKGKSDSLNSPVPVKASVPKSQNGKSDIDALLKAAKSGNKGDIAKALKQAA